MKEHFKKFDYISFPTDTGSDEVREGFIYRLNAKQIDVVSVRKKNGVNFADFGFHKKFLEKSRWGEIKHLELRKDMSSWHISQVVMWAMVRYLQSYGDFMTKWIKPHFEPPFDVEATEKEKVTNIITDVRHKTIARDRQAKQKV